MHFEAKEVAVKEFCHEYIHDFVEENNSVRKAVCKYIKILFLTVGLILGICYAADNDLYEKVLISQDKDIKVVVDGKMVKIKAIMHLRKLLDMKLEI